MKYGVGHSDSSSCVRRSLVISTRRGMPAQHSIAPGGRTTLASRSGRTARPRPRHRARRRSRDNRRDSLQTTPPPCAAAARWPCRRAAPARGHLQTPARQGMRLRLRYLAIGCLLAEQMPHLVAAVSAQKQLGRPLLCGGPVTQRVRHHQRPPRALQALGHLVCAGPQLSSRSVKACARRAHAPGDTSATRRMRTAPGSPSSGAAACVFKNAHSASCSSVAPPPHASSARPAAPCTLASARQEEPCFASRLTWSCW